MDRDTMERLRQIVCVQADEYRRRSELYGAAAHALDDFPASADSLMSAFDSHVVSAGFLQWANPVLERLNGGRPRITPTLLDAGCGIGTQSLTFGALGYAVTGIELNPDFVTLARARVGVYQERLQCAMACQFFAKDIFKVLSEQRYDVVWAREAISHIHPLERFLSDAYRALQPGGMLVIVDSNWSNPLVKTELFRSYWRHYRPFRTWGEASIHYVTQRRDPETGKPVDMAMERVLTLGRTMRKFEDAGFSGIRGKTLGLLPKSTLAALCTKDDERRVKLFDALTAAENALLRLPGVRSLGRINVVIGTRQ